MGDTWRIPFTGWYCPQERWLVPKLDTIIIFSGHFLLGLTLEVKMLSSLLNRLVLSGC